MSLLFKLFVLTLNLGVQGDGLLVTALSSRPKEGLEHSDYLVNNYEIICNAFPSKGRKKCSGNISFARSKWTLKLFLLSKFGHIGCVGLLALFPQMLTSFVNFICFSHSLSLFFFFFPVPCWPLAPSMISFLVPFLLSVSSVWFCVSISLKLFLWRTKIYIDSLRNW